MGQIQALFDDSDQHISGDRDPYLGSHRVLAGAQKRLDEQVLLVHLKNSSTCQRCRYKSVIISGASAKLLVRKVMRFPVSSFTTMRRRGSGYSLLE